MVKTTIFLGPIPLDPIKSNTQRDGYLLPHGRSMLRAGAAGAGDTSLVFRDTRGPVHRVVDIGVGVG